MGLLRFLQVFSQALESTIYGFFQRVEIAPTRPFETLTKLFVQFLFDLIETSEEVVLSLALSKKNTEPIAMKLQPNLMRDPEPISK